VADEVESTEGAEGEVTGTDQDKTEDRADATFTQADLDRVVKERVQRERGKFSDYKDLKAASVRLQEIEDSQKSETEKLTTQLAESQEQNARLLEAQTQTVIRHAVEAEARRVGFVHPEAAYSLADMAEIQLSDEGKVMGVADAIKTLSETYPELLATEQPKMAATNPGRTAEQGETDQERRARLFGYGGASPFGRGSGGGVIMPKEL